jgi:hypothetical protein
MSGACSTYGTDEEWLEILVGNLKKRDHLEYIGIDGMIILKWIFKEIG